jgi:hypothetical protein
MYQCGRWRIVATAEKENLQFWSCGRKKRFVALADAMTFAFSIAPRKTKEVRMKVYPCRYCKGFHLQQKLPAPKHQSQITMPPINEAARAKMIAAGLIRPSQPKGTVTPVVIPKASAWDRLISWLRK